MPELRDVCGESERLQKSREAVRESSEALARLTRETRHQRAGEDADPRAAVDQALSDLSTPRAPAA